MSTRTEQLGVVVVAAGRGTRAGVSEDGLAKQYQALGGVPVLSRTLTALLDHPAIQQIQVVIHRDDQDHYDACAPADERLLTPVFGGETRMKSVRNGLEKLSATDCDCVLIHDAARPFVTREQIDRLIAGFRQSDGRAQIPGLEITDTVKQVAGDMQVVASPPRSGLRRAQTPQMFRLSQILQAHRLAATAPDTAFTDDASVLEWLGVPVDIVAGSPTNIKLTTPEDFVAVSRQFDQDMETRMATGYDVHRFTDGDAVVLGGVSIPHPAALAGHSDADVALHALTDALLGCLGVGDIGTLFPPSDPQWAGADSAQFLADPVQRIARAGGEIVLLDTTIICEAPKIGPHRDRMQQRIAEICQIKPHQVSIKATTTEGLGFLGRREGIACQAAATIRLPRTQSLSGLD